MMEHLYNVIHFDDRYDQGLYINLNYVGNNNLENIVFNNSLQMINKGYISLMNFSTVESNTTKIYYGYSFTDTDKTLIDNILLIKNRNKEYLSFKKR